MVISLNFPSTIPLETIHLFHLDLNSPMGFLQLESWNKWGLERWQKQPTKQKQTKKYHLVTNMPSFCLRKSLFFLHFWRIISPDGEFLIGIFFFFSLLSSPHSLLACMISVAKFYPCSFLSKIFFHLWLLARFSFCFLKFECDIPPCILFNYLSFWVSLR